VTYDRSRLESDLRALEGVPVFVAYNANVDAVVRVDAELESALDRPTAPGERAPPSPLTSKRDLAAAITHAMAAGRGDEVAMADEFAAALESGLDPDVQQMGGQTGIITNLVSALGGAPIAYTYLLSDRQLSMFDHPSAVRYPAVENGRVALVPLREAPAADRTKINVEGALLAGYHNLTPAHVDDGYAERLRHARDVLRRFRAGGDPKVHVECAVTHDDDLREAIYELILPEANVIGADTNELAVLHDDAGIEAVDDEPTDTTPFGGDEILTHYRMLSALREDLDVECIRLHAMEYHLAVMDSYLSPEAVLRGMKFAAVNAAAKAARGGITAPGDLETGLTYDPSTDGREAIERLAEHVDEAADDGELCTPTVVACPNRIVEDPAGTVGIGDVVSASSFALELAVAEDHREPEP